MAKIMTDLALRLQANDAELKKGLKSANKRIDKFGKSNKTVGQTVQGAWMKIGAAVVAAGALIKGAQKIIQSTQGTGDAFAQAMTGAKDAMSSLSRAVATADFDNLISNFKLAYKAGKEYEAVLDDIGDRTRSVNIYAGETKLAIMKLQTELTNTKLSDEERLKVVDEVTRLTMEQFRREEGLAKQRIENEKAHIKNTYNLTDAQTDQIVSYIKNYDDLTAVQQTNIIEATKAQMAMERYMGAVGAFEGSKKWVKLNDALQESVVGLSEQEKQYVLVGSVINNIIDEQRDGIGLVITDWLDAQTKLQKYINKGLMAKNMIKDVVTETNEAYVAADKLFGTFGYAPELAKGLMAMTDYSDYEFIAKIQATVDKVKALNDELNQSISDVITGFIETLAEGGIGAAFKSIFQTIGSYAISFGNLLLAQGLAIEAFKKSLETLQGAVAIGAGIALIAAGVAIRSMASKPPELAAGGLIYGDTLARVGEYSGASSNPEVVAPLDKLKSMLGGQNVHVTVDGVVSGRNLALVQRRQNEYN